MLVYGGRNGSRAGLIGGGRLADDLREIKRKDKAVGRRLRPQGPDRSPASPDRADFLAPLNPTPAFTFINLRELQAIYLNAVEGRSKFPVYDESMVNLSGVSLRIARLVAIASVSSFAFITAASAQGGWYDPRWEALSPSERVIIDRVASEIYVDAMRAQAGWGSQGNAMRAVDPRYAASQYRTLAEPQKAPFRAYAISQLTGAAQGGAAQGYVPQQPYQSAAPYEAAPYQPAPEPAMRNEI